ncbi:MAG: DNA polymerase-3 subunit delta [Verrucomicrobiales bacterium]|jgi:DNA polymerase-3 subunit delta
MTIRLLKGNDDSLLSRAVSDAIASLVGAGDASLMVEELTEEQYRMEDDSFAITRLVDAAQTPPFLTERRVVVGRHMGRFSKGADVEALVAYLASPLPSTDLLLVWERGLAPKQDRMPAVPKSLNEAVKAAGGEVVETGIPSGKNASAWLDRQFKTAAVTIDARAAQHIAAHLGEQRSRVVSLLSTLESVYGPDVTIGVDDVQPFLGESGDVPPWDLTDAIDSGKIDVALDKLHRMTEAGGRHPLQIMSSLQTHYLRMLRLDGAPISGEKQAAQLLGMKGSTFPAKKALNQAKKLGSAGVRRAVELLAEADRGLRGESGWPPELVMEVLVARLANLR